MKVDPFSQARILIVDDDPLNVVLLESILREAGIGQLISTTDSRRVLQLYLEQHPDLLILDLMMPHLDGFAVMAGLKPHIPANRYLPMLMITGETDPEVRRKALASGAADFLTKPFDEIETVLRVRNLIEISQLQRQLQSRIARDIHDGPLQDLGVVLLHIEATQRLLQDGANDAAVAQLRAMREGVRELLGQWRGVVSEMRPQSLRSHGFTGALQELGERVQQESGIAVQVSIHLDDTPTPELEIVLYRLAQESLSNVRQHSQATHAWVTLRQRGGEIDLTVRDDGQGFEVQPQLRQALVGGHFGLAGMYERAAAANGRLVVSSAPGEGTTLEFNLPFSGVTIPAAERTAKAARRAGKS